MKDIDFDELDRAVSSLMGGSKANKEAATPPVENNTNNQPVENEPEDTKPVRPPEATKPRPLPRSSGRFMDVVSAPARPRPVAAAPNREGATIQRSQEDVNNNVKVTNNKTDSQDSLSPQKAETKPDTGSSSAVNEPVSSPFLPNAKVEKRPLGNLTSSQSEESESKSEVSKSYETDKEVTVPPKDAPSEPQPELDNDLLKIESNEKETNHDAADTSHVSSSDQSDTYGTTKPVTSSSINQQYTEKESSGDQSHAAIYDTSSYSQPLAHPAKRKSGWMWVVWIVLLLAVGSGSAIALYYLGVL